MAITDPGALNFTVPARKDFILDGKMVDALIWDAITGGEVETTIEGASTLTLNVTDSRRQLVESRIMNHRVYMRALELDWALVQTTKQGDDFTLVFEDARVTALRSHRGRVKVSRGKRTRAEFIRDRVKLVKKFKIIFVCPELHKQQPQRKRGRTRADRDADREPGFADKVKLPARSGNLTKNQKTNAARVLTQADDENARGRARLALITACLIEGPDFSNPTGGEGTSAGILQLTGEKGSVARRRDIEHVVHLFLTNGFTGRGGAIEIARENPGMSAGEIAQAVQGSAYPDRYDEVIEQARKINDAWNAGDSVGEEERTVRWAKAYEFMQGPPDGPEGEDVWAMSARLAEEVGWRRFIVRNRFYYMTDEDLMRSRPIMELKEDAPGIETIDYDVDVARTLDHATVTCRMNLWSAPPGSVVTIEDKGPAFGRWLVRDIRRDLFGKDGTIELIRKGALLAEKPEPRAETGERTKEGRTSEGSKGAASLKDGEWNPKSIIDDIVLPLARECGIKRTVAENDAANRRHGPTVDGNPSDHQGPARRAWAADMSNGNNPTKEMDKLADLLAKTFQIKWDGSGMAESKQDGFRFQLIYRCNPCGGNHMNHVHFGVKKL